MTTPGLTTTRRHHHKKRPARAGRERRAVGGLFVLAQEDRRGARAGSPRERLPLDAALVGAHAPAARSIRRDEVDVRALGERPVVTQRPAAAYDVDLFHILHPDDEMRHTRLREADPLLSLLQPKWQLRLHVGHRP